MRALAAIMICGAIALWSTAAWAQYSALGETPEYGPWIGVGGMLISGDNGAGDSDSEFVPTVNLSGLTEYIAWQAFYGFGADSTVFGGNVDYIIADNFDECFACPDMGTWWFGAGLSMIDVSDLYVSDTDSGAALDDTYFGGNLGFGYIWNEWSFNLYTHLFEDQFAVQGSINYALDYNK